MPGPVVLGMLAGVLLRFGTDLFAARPRRPLLVVAMLATSLPLRRRGVRAPTVGARGAGLAMTPALVSALAGALTEPDERLGAVFALLPTAADIRLLEIGAPFWGLVLGALTSRLVRGASR